MINYINNNLNNSSKKLILIPHLELGDNIIFNGIVRHYCSIFDNVILVCKKMYEKQINYMYSDLNNLTIYPVKGGAVEGINLIDEFYYDSDINNLLIKCNTTFLPVSNSRTSYTNIFTNVAGVVANVINRSHYPKIFFDELELPYEFRYTKFKINRDYSSEDIIYNKLVNIVGNKYIVIIDDEKRNIVIDIRYITNEYPIFKLGNNSINKDERLETVKSDNIFNYIKLLENANEIHTIDSSIVLLIDALNLNVKTYIHRYARPQPVEYNNPNFLYIT